MFVIIKKGEIVGTKCVLTLPLKVLSDNKVLKNLLIGYANICLSAQVHRQNF